MKYLFFALLTFLSPVVLGATPEIRVPEKYLQLIKTTDFVEVSGTNDLGGAENFTIHNSKAISQFVQFLTSDRYEAVPKSLKPHFKSLSVYHVRLSAKGSVVLEFQIVADSVLDIPDEAVFYMQSDRHSDNLMAPLLRLR